MRRLLRFAAILLGGLLVSSGLCIVAVDALIVQPALSKVDAAIARAAPSEQRPPDVVVEMLRRAYGDRLKYLVAREALTSPPNQVDGINRLNRQLTELAVSMLIPLHRSPLEPASAYASMAYMGPGIRGLSSASNQYLGVALERLTASQAAKLVAIAHAPSAYLVNAEQAERRAQHLLSLQPE